MTIPAGFAQVTHTFQGTSLPLGAAITYGIDHDSSAPPDVVAQDLHDDFVDTILTELVTTVNISETIVKFGPDETGPSGIFADSMPGGDADVQSPPNVAFLIHKNTGLGGRRGRGRWYLPGVGEPDVGPGGLITLAKQDALQIDVSAFRGLVIAHTYTTGMFVLHSPSAPGTEHPTPEPPPTAINSLTVDGAVATQRRRLRR